MKWFSLAVTSISAVAALSTSLSAADETHHPSQAPAAAVTAEMAEGVVRKVDKDAGKITIKHGPLVNLDMPAMTMVFRTHDPAMLDQVKQGDKVRFQAEIIDGTYVVTKFQTVK